MGRNKAYNEGKALWAALEVFWKNGFESTSMEDLLKAMNISRSSFYDTFQNKELVYLRSMEMFYMMSDEGFALTIESPDASFPEIVLHFTLTRRMQWLDENKGSCYISNCALEMGSMNPEVTLISKKFFSRYAQAFAMAIKNGIQKGEISSDKDPESTAWYLVNNINGLGILNKSGTTTEQLDSVIKTVLSIFKNFTVELYNKKIKEADEVYAPMIKKQMEGEDWMATET